ncbi:hypothetical protein DM194_19225 (plasmid) [Azospirillum ramasamyi]|uniref:2-oxoisovalerate dehydrogenase E1 alpha subunit N-terminal domain-containing protein n=1 Tax=Azospirillum ramasamyi TaxID=682998 RepID=A0A2U9SBQ7_9PROT|nr:hypothetical protein DM194_19225 [Azospirillum ramasamyi]
MSPPRRASFAAAGPGVRPGNACHFSKLKIFHSGNSERPPFSGW